MRILFTLLAISFVVVSVAQPTSNISVSTDSVGVNTLNNTAIKGKTYELPTSVYEFYLDTTSNHLTFLLREKPEYNNTYKRKGFLGVLNTKTDSLLWLKPFDFKKTTIIQHQNYLLEHSDFGCNRIATETGEKTWIGKTEIRKILPEFEIGIGIRVDDNNRYRYHLEGIDLKLKTKLWSREIICKDDWDKTQLWDNNTLIIKNACEIIVVDIKTGAGWNAEIKTIKAPSAGAIAGVAAAGILTGVLTGVAVVPNTNEITGINSNVLIHKNYLYLAHGDSLTCWNKTGEVMWRFGFPKKQCSKSNLFIQNNQLCMINRGYAYSQNVKVSHGRPFIAAFDVNTGKQHYLETPITESNPINDFENTSDTITLVTYEQAVKFSVQNGVKIIESKKEPSYKGYYRYLVAEPIYQLNSGNIYQPISQPDELLISCSDDRLVKTDWQGKMMSAHPIANCYKLTHAFATYKLIANQTTTLVIDHTGKHVATLQLGLYAQLNGTVLWQQVKNKFIMVDIAAFMQ